MYEDENILISLFCFWRNVDSKMDKIDVFVCFNL